MKITHRNLLFSLTLFLGIGGMGGGAAYAVEENLGLTGQIMDTKTGKMVATINQTGPVSNLLGDLHEKFLGQILTGLKIDVKTLPPQVRQELATPKSKSLAAVVYYGAALDAVDKGNLAAAKALFGFAAKTDPSFNMATIAYAATPLTKTSVTTLTQTTLTQIRSQADKLLTEGYKHPIPHMPRPPSIPPNPAAGGNLAGSIQTAMANAVKITTAVNLLVNNMANNPKGGAEAVANAIKGGLPPDLALTVGFSSGGKKISNETTEKMVAAAIAQGLTVGDVNKVIKDITSSGTCK